MEKVYYASGRMYIEKKQEIEFIDPSFLIESVIDGDKFLKDLERYGRTCYKSEEKITSESAPRFVKMLLKRGHESVIEHICVSVRIIHDRGISHETVRHRIASYSQESTRYCTYNDFIEFIDCSKFLVDNESIKEWKEVLQFAANAYKEIARNVLPMSLKTEWVMTMNLREWRLFFKQRTAPDAHPQMRQISIPLLNEFKEKIPIVFNDINSEKL